MSRFSFNMRTYGHESFSTAGELKTGDGSSPFDKWRQELLATNVGNSVTRV